MAVTVGLLAAIFFSMFGAAVAFAQEPTPPAPGDIDKARAILQLAIDALQVTAQVVIARSDFCDEAAKRLKVL